ncbi:NIF family HAD-type phosphatase [Candidatus Uabimicrobium sp. HlEnr_7]|uniref:NIF family HAD-type phosphatase n=1 Tax=Candidatus Uabimicrobium helgolandensis TaxID=3095367 RepID=UPI003555C961
MSEYHVALDVDDTILGGPDSVLRPHLKTLFEFCASNFATISLLTLSRESECRRKLGELYDEYVTQHIYAFPRKENNFSTNKDLRWIHNDISKVIMVEDPLAETLNIDWQQQKDRYIVVSAFDFNNPQEDNELLSVIETMEKKLKT